MNHLDKAKICLVWLFVGCFSLLPILFIESVSAQVNKPIKMLVYKRPALRSGHQALWTFNGQIHRGQAKETDLSEVTNAALDFDRFQKANYAIAFDKGYARIPAKQYYPNPAFTIGFWIKVTGFEHHMRVIESSDGLHDNEIGVSVDSNSKQARLLLRHNSSTVNTCFTQSALTIGKWTHIAFTFESGVVKAFFKGNQETECTFDLPFVNTVRINNFIGKSVYSGVGLLNAVIDDISIYSRALTPKLIANPLSVSVHHARDEL